MKFSPAVINTSPRGKMPCAFDPETLRCRRCGFLSQKLPHFRPCETIEEIARDYLHRWAHARIQIPPARIGSWIASALSAVGVTEGRVKKLIGKDCGCAKRKSRLDALGEGATAAIQLTANRALNVILPHPITEDDVAALAQSIAASPWTNQGLRDKAAGR